MAKNTLQPPKVRKGISSKELAADAPDADKAPVRPDYGEIPALQKITGKWPANNF
jgi:hypothetical protein